MSYRIYDLNCEICGGTATARLCRPCEEMVSRLVGIADRNEEAFKREIVRQSEAKAKMLAEKKAAEEEKAKLDAFIDWYWPQSGGKRGPWKKG